MSHGKTGTHAVLVRNVPGEDAKSMSRLADHHAASVKRSAPLGPCLTQEFGFEWEIDNIGRPMPRRYQRGIDCHARMRCHPHRCGIDDPPNRGGIERRTILGNRAASAVMGIQAGGELIGPDRIDVEDLEDSRS